MWREAIALPLADDYHAILVFALDQQRLSSAGKLLNILAAQHTEYKLIFEHAVVAADLAFTGKLHLLFLVWLGNVLLLPLGLVLWAQFRPADPLQKRLKLFVPVCWLLFQLTYAELIDWSMEGLQALAVICFAAIALYLLVRGSRRSFVLACITGVLAALSSANGFLVAVIGVVLLIRQGRSARIFAWCIAFALALAAYLYRYSPAQHGIGAALYVRLLFIPSFLGGAIENMHGRPIPHSAAILGVAMLLVYAHALRSGYYKQEPFIIALTTWVILTAALTGWVRSSMGLNLSFSSRYKIYSALMIVFCYQYLADRVISGERLSPTAKRRLYGITLCGSILFALASDAVGLKLLRNRKTEAIAALGWYLAAPQTHSPFPNHLGVPDEANDSTGAATEARQALTDAIASGIYSIPPKERAKACASSHCQDAPL